MTSLLFIEDDDSIRLALSLALEDEGYDVREAANGLEAIAMLEEPGIDAVLLDLRMAPVDGWEVLEHLRANDRLPGLPVVMLSAHADPAMAARALELGCSSYMSKPFAAADLLAAIAAGEAGRVATS